MEFPQVLASSYYYGTCSTIINMQHLIILWLGQYSSRSTASLQQHLGSVIKVLVTTVHMASDTEERKKFFQQQAAIAEMIHPNIACHFVIRDEGWCLKLWVIRRTSDISAGTLSCTNYNIPIQVHLEYKCMPLKLACILSILYKHILLLSPVCS